MKGYLSIGKVAKLKNVSIKSLRYYDEIGVLKPAYINPTTNYRYYTENQLFLLDAIILCLELGIPLKELSHYVEDDTINLQKLLYEGKWRAEEKIKTIRNCLTHLQECLESYEQKPVTLPKPTHYDRYLKERKILAQTLEDTDATDNLSNKILRLFMLAQLLEIKVTYPSGLLYEYDETGCTRSVFITIQDTNGSYARQIRTLPEGYYLCEQHHEHKIDQANNLFASFIDEKKPYFLIETDVFEEGESPDDNTPLELQYYIGKKNS